MKSLLVATSEERLLPVPAQQHRWDTCGGNAHIVRVRGALLLAGASVREVESIESIPEDKVLENENDWMAELPLATQPERSERTTMPEYQKLTLELFRARIKEGKYESAAGARRAIGKADWDEADREAAKKLVDKTFPDTEEKAPKEKTKKAAKAVEASGDAPKRRGRPPKNPEAKTEKKPAVKATPSESANEAPKRRGRPPKTTALAAVGAQDKKVTTRAPRGSKMSFVQDSANSLQETSILLSNISSVINSATTAEKSSLSLNKEMLSELCNNVIQIGVAKTREMLPVLPQKEEEEASATNGVSHKVIPAAVPTSSGVSLD